MKIATKFIACIVYILQLNRCVALAPFYGVIKNNIYPNIILENETDSINLNDINKSLRDYIYALRLPYSFQPRRRYK